MNKYDNIYSPIQKGDPVCMDDNYYVYHEGFAGPTGPPVEVLPQKNVIVLTLEELREVWDKGYVRGCEEYENKQVTHKAPCVAPNFIEYLQSKGIA